VTAFLLFTRLVKTKINFFFIVLLFLLASPLCFSTDLPQEQSKDHEWILSKKSSVMSLFYRDIANSGLIEIRATTHFNSSLSGFILFFQDSENTKNWLENAYESQILKKIDANTHIVKTKFKGFWLFKNRHMNIKSHYRQNEDLSLEFIFENADDKTPKSLESTSNSILIDVISARWLIVPVKNNNIAIEYNYIVDAKGDIPHWLINKAILNSTWQSLENIRRQLPLSKWQSSTLSHIKELD